MKKKYNKIIKKQALKVKNSLPLWNLGDLYPSIRSKKIIIDLNYIDKSSKAYEKKYEGKVFKLSSNNLLKAILELALSIKHDK